MKFLLLALCLGFALAFPNRNNNKYQPRIQETSYRPNKEYTYHYDTQALTGLPQNSQIHAGFRLSCLARVQFITRSRVRVQFDKLVLYRINEPVVQWEASERLIPEEFLKELVGDEASTMEHFLRIPFGFEYDDGQVLRILLQDKETTWSANIKRGFVSLFEMNLEKRFLLDESFPALKSQMPPHVNWYNVFERAPTGDCATLYTVTPNSENDQKYVTKVRDYNRCLTRPIYINSMWDGHYLENAQQDKPMTNGATVKYTLRGNDRKFLILTAIGESHIVVSPYKNQEQVRTTLNQTLSLKEAKFIGRQVQEIPEVRHGKHKSDTIRMTLPSSPVDCQDPFLPCDKEPKQVSEPADVYSVDKIHLHLQMAARNTHEITSEESLQHLRIVKDMLKKSPQQILKKLWEKLYITKVNPRADIDRLSADIYWNVLPNVGTEASANVVLDICSTDFLMTSNCTQAVRSLALKTTPTTEIIKKLIKLTRVGRLTKEVKQAAYLTLGTFGYKLTRHWEKHTKQCEQAIDMLQTLTKGNNKQNTRYIRLEKRQMLKRCDAITNKYMQSEEKILKTLKKLIESPKQDDKILGLKAIGNSGLPRSLPILRRYLEDKTENNIVRLQAIISHRRIQYPESARQQAIQTLLKLYLTTSETSEIRSFCFVFLNTLRPDLTIYETITMSLRHEKDAQLSSFVYKLLSLYSNSTYKPDTPLKLKAEAALKFAPEIQPGYEHVFMNRFGYYSEDNKRGAAIASGLVGDMSRYFGGCFKLETYNFGLISELFEVGFNTEGLNPFLTKLFGPHGLLTNNKSFFDLLRRGRRDISPQEQIHQILKKLNIQPRTMPIPYGHLYFKMMGHELGYLDFTHLLRTITTTGNYPVQWDEEGLKLGLPLNVNTMHDFSDEQMTLPTEAGLPVSITFQLMTTVKVEGALTFKVTPFMYESDRQGQPPIGVHAKLDLKPKVVAEMQSSMGLDMFYYKPVVGYRGLVKYNAPIQKELKVDLTYRRLNLKWYNPVMEKPAVEMIMEPYSEFLVITKKNDSPVLVSDRRNIFASSENRVYPISHNYKINALGYRLAVTGQLPRCVSKTNPLRPFCGRSLVNIFWKPMENAPATFNFYIQDILPLKESVAKSYAQSYQNERTDRPEQYGRDMTRMEDSNVELFDKNGYPLPRSLDDILPPRDQSEVEKEPINMQQLCEKFQRLFKKPMPFYNQEDARAIVFMLDASSKGNKRQVMLETIWKSFKDGHVGRMFARFWRSALPDYDTQEWQMLSEMGVTYPFQVKEPKDIFDPKWQRELMKDLEYLVSMESHKVVNQGINMTMLSGVEQVNYPSMVRVPTYRVLESLIPEQLYRLMNLSGNTIYNRKWDSYWHYLAPIYRQVKEDVRLISDPYFVNRDLSLADHMLKLKEVQEYLLRDLQDIVAKTVVAHAELPIIQYINYMQSRTVYKLRQIYNWAIVNNRLHKPEEIRMLLTIVESNCDDIMTQFAILMKRVTTVSQQLDREGRPVVVFKPEVLRKTSKMADVLLAISQERYHQYPEYQTEEPSYYTTTENRNQQPRQNEQFERMFVMRYHLYNLTLVQINFIEELQNAISNNKQFELKHWTNYLHQLRDFLNVFDEELKNQQILDPVTRQSLLLATLQNEFGIELLEQWKRIVPEKLNIKTMTQRMQYYSRHLMFMKEYGVFFGERVSFLYRHDLSQRIVVPNLDRQEYPIYQQIVDSKRVLMTEMREFQVQMAYNTTNMKKPELVVAYFDKFTQALISHLNKVAGVEEALLQLGQNPKLYTVSELMDVLHYMKYMSEFGTRTLYSIKDQRRFTYLEKLSTVATKIQTLISTMSPIFNKYEQSSNVDKENRMSILNTMPIDTRVLDVQDVLVQQKMLKQQIRRFIQNPDVSSDVLSQVLSTIIDRCDLLQQTLKQNQIQVQSAIEQRRVQFQRQAISSVWSEALNQQRSLYEAMLNIYSNNRDNLQDVVRSTDRINALEMEIVEMEGSHQQTMETVRNQNRQEEYEEEYSDSYRTPQYNDEETAERTQQQQRKLQPLTPFEYLPTGVTALFNFTWGNEYKLDKNVKLQFMASRSVEQIMYMFRQLSAVLRSQDVVESINRRLADEPWLSDEVMQKFNTFNHWHLIAEANKDQLPEWWMKQLNYVQDYLKANLWSQYKRQPATNIVGENQFQAMIDISQFNNQWDLYLLGRDETNVYQGMRLSKWAKQLPIIQNYRPLQDKLMSYMTYNHKPTQCMVNQDKIYTFDNVNYQLPQQLRKTESLLAADCSHDKSFAITMIKSNTSFEGHIIKLINEDQVVEVIPGYLDTEVRVNGQEVVLEDNKPVTYSKRLHYDLYEPSLKIVRKGWRIEVTFPLTGIQFLMEGTYTQIKVSHLYKRRLCGLCSNFDNQMSWEYEGPGMEVYSSPKNFAMSYILHKQQQQQQQPRDQRHRFQPYRPKGSQGEYTEDNLQDIISSVEQQMKDLDKPRKQPRYHHVPVVQHKEEQYEHVMERMTRVEQQQRRRDQDDEDQDQDQDQQEQQEQDHRRPNKGQTQRRRHQKEQQEQDQRRPNKNQTQRRRQQQEQQEQQQQQEEQDQRRQNQEQKQNPRRQDQEDQDQEQIPQDLWRQIEESQKRRDEEAQYERRQDQDQYIEEIMRQVQGEQDQDEDEDQEDQYQPRRQQQTRQQKRKDQQEEDQKQKYPSTQVQDEQDLDEDEDQEDQYQPRRQQQTRQQKREDQQEDDQRQKYPRTQTQKKQNPMKQNQKVNRRPDQQEHTPFWNNLF